MDIIFGIGVLAISVILHEVAHGYMANWLGDPTARLEGRLTLNPISHVDLVGTVLLPLGLWMVQGFSSTPLLIGYAKPVPYNPYNLRGKYAEALVAFAGPATNIILAVIFGLAIRFLGGSLTEVWLVALANIVIINTVLALFNLIPIPPLDGSKVLSGILLAISPALERGYDSFRRNFERLGMLAMVLIVLVVFQYLLYPFFSALLSSIFTLLTGVPA